MTLLKVFSPQEWIGVNQCLWIFEVVLYYLCIKTQSKLLKQTNKKLSYVLRYLLSVFILQTNCNENIGFKWIWLIILLYYYAIAFFCKIIKCFMEHDKILLCTIKYLKHFWKLLDKTQTFWYICFYISNNNMAFFIYNTAIWYT